MNTFDFTSVPVIGNIMNLTGINDGWIVISIFLLILAIVFLVAWISSSSKNRAANKELELLRDEIVGLQALTNLPPLHEGDWDYTEGADPGSSLVFASAKELRRREKGQAPKKAVKPKDEPKTAEEPAQKPASTSPSVTAQVHKAIFESVAVGHLKTPKAADPEPEPKSDMVGNRKRKANGAAITSSDLPPIKLDKPAKKKTAKKPEPNPDASLSSRIPHL